MAGQSPSRRELLQAFSLAALASAVPGFSRWCFAFDERSRTDAAGAAHIASAQRYVPQFFSPSEYKTIEVLTELILPSDGGPGAKEAGVSEFIDFMVKSDAALQEPFRQGLAWLDGARGNGRSFVGLLHAEQTRLLDRLAYKKYQRAEEKPGQDFFRLVRRYTVMGFYTTKIGLEALDYPGLKFYATSPGCPHPGNPEHIGI
jgi:gluconate 2-dehydrogenase gamma chain